MSRLTLISWCYAKELGLWIVVEGISIYLCVYMSAYLYAGRPDDDLYVLLLLLLMLFLLLLMMMIMSLSQRQEVVV